MRPFDSRSSAVSTCATSTVNSGVVALRIEARPLAMWVWPHAMSENGIALFSSPMPKKASQVLASHGIGERVAAQHEMERRRRDRDPQQHDGEGRHRLHRHADKEERPAPQDREGEQQGPVQEAHAGGGGHREVCTPRPIATLPASCSKSSSPKMGEVREGEASEGSFQLCVRLPPPQPSPGSGEGIS